MDRSETYEDVNDVDDGNIYKRKDSGVKLCEAPDEVLLCNFKDMEMQAQKMIPDIANEDASVTIGNDNNEEEEDSASVKSDDTMELMEKIQQQARQLVSFENYVDPNKVVENDDDAEDDDYMLRVLRDKDMDQSKDGDVAEASSSLAPL